jgi:PST family polysaccharide transporter
VTPLSVLGLSGLISRELINHPTDEAKIMGTALTGRLVGAVLTSLVLVLLAFALEFREPYWILIIALTQVLSFCTVIDFWLQARLQAKVSAVVRLSVLFLISLGKLFIVWKDLELQSLVYLYALEFVLLAFAYCFAYLVKGGSTNLRCDNQYFKALLSQSKWLIFSGIAAVVYLKIDVVMLRHLASESEAGIYSVASRISEIWYFIPTIVVTSFFPLLLKARKESLASYQQKLQKLNDYLFFLALSVVIIVILAAQSIISIFGPEYLKATEILKVHIFAGLFIFMRALLSKWLIMESLLKYSLVTQASGALINILFNVLLIPKYQGVGAAYATLISYAAASYFALFLSKDTRPMAAVMTRSICFPLRWLR